MTKAGNARKFSRSNISIATRITPAGAAPVDAMVIDLSMNGILVQSDTTLNIGMRCHISILLGHYMHELPISAKGIVIRSHDDMFAICFDAVGIESTEELQEMILFHSNDPKLCLQEFNQIDSRAG